MRVEDINSKLVDLYGVDISSGQPIWRVVFSEDQFEKRLGTYTDYTPNGLFIREVTEVREVPKYRQWIPKKWVLERLVAIPDANVPELPVTKMSYEPMFIFENAKGEALPPKLEVCIIVVDTVYAAQGKTSLAKYVDEEAKNDPKRKQAVGKIYEELFGEETKITDALARGSAITVPGKEN